MLRPFQNYHREFEKPRKKHRDAWYLAFGVLFANTENILSNHVSMLVNGTLTPNQLGAVTLNTLNHAHATGYSIGANSIGADLTPAEAQPLVSRTMYEQAQFLGEFMEDLESKDPRYVKTLEELYPEIGDEKDIIARIKAGDIIQPHPIEDEGNEYYDEKAIQWRMQLYAERVRGTANWGAVNMLGVSEPIYWRDTKLPGECEECPERAATIWFKGTLPGVPGDGSTPCGVRCRCHLELDDGTVIQF